MPPILRYRLAVYLVIDRRRGHLTAEGIAQQSLLVAVEGKPAVRDQASHICSALSSPFDRPWTLGGDVWSPPPPHVSLHTQLPISGLPSSTRLYLLVDEQSVVRYADRDSPVLPRTQHNALEAVLGGEANRNNESSVIYRTDGM
jgi:hypothetical protein